MAVMVLSSDLNRTESPSGANLSYHAWNEFKFKISLQTVNWKKSSKCFIVSNLSQRSNSLSKHRNFSSNPFFISFDQHIKNKMHKVKLLNVHSHSKIETTWFSCSPVICLSAEYPTSNRMCWALRFLCLSSGKCKWYNNWTQNLWFVLCKNKVATKSGYNIFRYAGEKNFFVISLQFPHVTL